MPTRISFRLDHQVTFIDLYFLYIIIELSIIEYQEICRAILLYKI